MDLGDLNAAGFPDLDPPTYTLQAEVLIRALFQEWIALPSSQQMIQDLSGRIIQDPRHAFEHISGLERQPCPQSPPAIRSPTRARQAPESPSALFSPTRRAQILAQTPGSQQSAVSDIPRITFGPSAALLQPVREAVMREMGTGNSVHITQEFAAACQLPQLLAPLIYTQIMGVDPAQHARAAPGSPTHVAPRRRVESWLTQVVYCTDRPEIRLWKLLNQASETDAEDELTTATVVVGADGVHGRSASWLTRPMLTRAFQLYVTYHPSLGYLRKSQEFQDLFVMTLTTRALFQLDSSFTDRVRLREWLQSTVPQAFFAADTMSDINSELTLFSYEHFYVIYCSFWQLDTDHTLRISADDLARYNTYALSVHAGERIFRHIGRGRGGVPTPRMLRELQAGTRQENMWNLEDFVIFLLAEEDKDSRTSIHYWFNIADLDGDGYLGPNDIEFWWTEMNDRLARLGNDATVPLAYIRTQINDMVRPAEPPWISEEDIAKCRTPGNVFNILFNLSKFLAFETKDPYTVRYKNTAETTQFQRWCRFEYDQLTRGD